MARLVPRDDKVREVDVRTERGTKRYRISEGGTMNVDNPNHAKQLKSEGFIEASLAPYTRGTQNLGYNCPKCGFGGWFSTCGRCGSEAVKAGE